VDYLRESALAIYRRRRRRRAIFTMICVAMVLLWSVLYASSYVQGWVPKADSASLINASCSESTTRQPLKPPDVTVNVYNSTARTGLAAVAARAMMRQGFKVASTDNDPLGKSVLTVGEIRHGPTGLEGAQIVATRLPGATLVLDDRLDATVDVVVGSRFRGVKAPPKVVVKKKSATAPNC
jgi:hypothetical protein